MGEELKTVGDYFEEFSCEKEEEVGGRLGSGEECVVRREFSLGLEVVMSEKEEVREGVKALRSQGGGRDSEP